MSGLIYRDIITQIRRSFLGNIIPDILFFSHVSHTVRKI